MSSDWLCVSSFSISVLLLSASVTILTTIVTNPIIQDVSAGTSQTVLAKIPTAPPIAPETSNIFIILSPFWSICSFISGIED